MLRFAMVFQDSSRICSLHRTLRHPLVARAVRYSHFALVHLQDRSSLLHLRIEMEKVDVGFALLPMDLRDRQLSLYYVVGEVIAVLEMPLASVRVVISRAQIQEGSIGRERSSLPS